jgi:hypothetical protein
MDKLFKESRRRRIESGDLTVEEVIEESGLGAKLKARGEAIGEARAR